MATVIDIDSFKEKIEGYNPANASEFHEISSKMADQAYRLAVKSKKYKNVIFLCGGSATGKTEFIKSYLNEYDDETLIFDSTLSGLDGLKSKLSKVKNKYKVTVIFIQPDNLLISFLVFNNRERKFHHKHFVRTHSGSRAMFLYVLENYDMIDCRYFFSTFDDEPKMIFKETKANRAAIINLIRKEQIPELVIEALISPYIKKR
jgi:hypothetical protein